METRVWLSFSPHPGRWRCRGPNTWQWTLPPTSVHPEMKEEHLGQFMGPVWCPVVVSRRSSTVEAEMAAFWLETLCGLASWGPGFLSVSHDCSLSLLESMSLPSSNIFFFLYHLFLLLASKIHHQDIGTIRGLRKSSSLWSQTASYLLGKWLIFLTFNFLIYKMWPKPKVILTVWGLNKTTL